MCGESHSAHTRNKKEEVTAAIEKLKSRHTESMLTILDRYDRIRILLVFGAQPRPIRTTPPPTELSRQQITKETKIAVKDEQVKRRV